MVLHFRQWRHACGLTLQAVSDDIALSVPELSLLERGKREPSLRVVQALAGRYQCHPWDLVSFPGFPAPACTCHPATQQVRA